MSSRLLALPRELRDMIWEYTVADTEIILGRETPGQRLKAELYLEDSHHYCHTNAGIVSVNNQVREETIELYNKNIIIRGAWRTPSEAVSWYTELPVEKRAQVLKLRHMSKLANDGFLVPTCQSEREVLEDNRHEVDIWLYGFRRALVREYPGGRPSVVLEVSMVEVDGRIVWVTKSQGLPEQFRPPRKGVKP